MPTTTVRTPAVQPGQATREPTSIVDGMLSLAVKHHSRRRLAEAERLYRAILAIEPRHAGCLHGLGKLARDVGRREIAAQLIRAAIAIEPLQTDYSVSLGGVLESLGKQEEAAAVYEQALSHSPDCADARLQLQDVLRALREPRQPAPTTPSFRPVVPKVFA